MFVLAEEKNLILAEAMTIWHMPIYKKLWETVRSGSDEQATILLKNHSGQMATVALSMHSKQPKRAMISCEKGYIEIMEYPRADKAVIVDAETGEKTEISCGDTSDALLYEMEDMEHAVLTHDTSGL